ncbi:MAG: DUF523 domain-containing protein [Firmicutes bacterium]|nr:DUF523 domain-containing protein [Bacillota bacterium]
MLVLPPGPILVSACLLGLACRYDGGHCRHEGVLRLLAGREIVPVCPEVLGGLAIPRPPAEIVGGNGHDVLAGRARVVDKTGRDVTEAFRRGAEAALAKAEACGVKAAVLKERSPSCGVRWIYDGSFTRRLRPGLGVAAVLLRERGIVLQSEEEFTAKGERGP